jgi:hypothetical protein
MVLSASQLISEDVGLSPEPVEEEGPTLEPEEEAEADDYIAPLKGHSHPKSAATATDSNPLNVDVNGKPRQGRVRLPSFIKASKPGAVVNSQFIRVEGDRRRTLKTASTAMITKLASSYVLGSFEVLPSHARFGVVRQGGVYSTYLTLTNVSNDSTRFLVKKPKSSNLTVNYKKGPVAPGMRVHVELLLDTKNLSSQEVVKLDDELVIVTEAEYLHIPVSAEIRSEAVFGSARMRASVLIVRPHAAVAATEE